MNIERIENNNTVTLKLSGWLDTAGAPDLGVQIESIGSETDSIILDFENVEYIASAGLRQVVACQKKAKEIGADFSVVNVTKEVMSIFKLTALDKKINIKEK